VSRPDWVQWQRLYETPERVVAQRLLIVRRLIRDFLASRGGDEVRVVSICSGQGRDILGVLADHPGRLSVTGRLVELDPANTEAAARRAHEAGLGRIEVVTGDASVTDAFAGVVPADLVLVCGVFGNIPDDDVHRTIEALPQFCARNATVIWTRHRGPPDLTPTIREWFAHAGFVEINFESTAAEAPRPGAFPAQFVCAHQWPRDPVALELGQRLFSFVR
jgi:hypothetical protein